jgi:quinol monooxygenase YgiN
MADRDRLVILVKMTAQEGRRDKLIETMQELVVSSCEEPGTLAYQLLPDLNNKDILWVYEVFTSRAGLDFHVLNPILKRTQDALKEYLAFPYEVNWTTPREGEGVPEIA